MIRATLARTVETKRPQSYEVVGMGADRQPTPYFSRVAPMIDDDGEVRSLVLISTDISRMKQAEAALAESQAMLLHVLRATGMGTWWWDRARNAGGHDAALARIFGADPGAGLDNLEQVLARIHPDDRDQVLASLGSAHDSGAYGPIEHRIVHPDGTTRWVQASGRLLHAGSGRRLVGGAVDITERKRLEVQLAQAQKMESIGRLAGGIAHDFNNMLTAILSYNQFALAAAPAGSRLAQDLGEVRRAAERSVALTSQLLAFARQQVIEPEIAELDAVVVRVLDLLRRVLGENIEVVTRLRARHRVKIDVNQFEQVLLNLATNARDAMPGGGRMTIETADVELEGSEAARHPELTPGPYAMLAVSDTGAGIEPHVLPRVFEPFFTTKAQGQGTGLGLATCYGIVAQNRGSIVVETAIGDGTTFRVYLPPAEGAPSQAAVPAPSEPATGAETVLVVEDEPSVRAVAIETLELAGFRVLAAAQGNEALALALAYDGTIDLLVTDVVMPQLGGRELARQLTAQRPKLAVLYVSGYTDDAVIHHRVVDGEVNFLQKPFSPSTLARRVRQAIDRGRA